MMYRSGVVASRPHLLLPSSSSLIPSRRLLATVSHIGSLYRSSHPPSSSLTHSLFHCRPTSYHISRFPSLSSDHHSSLINDPFSSPLSLHNQFHSSLSLTVPQPFHHRRRPVFKFSFFQKKKSKQSNPPPTSPSSTETWPLLVRHIMPFAPIGFVAGFVGSMTGVGGALVVAPLLQSFSSLVGMNRSSQASGTALMCCFAGALSGSITMLSNNAVDLHTAAAMGITAALSLPIGARVNGVLPDDLLQRILALAFLLFAPLVLIKSFAMHDEATDENIRARYKTTLETTPIVSIDSSFTAYIHTIMTKRSHPNSHEEHSPSLVSFVSLGAVVGLINGLIGFGGGLLACTSLTLTAGTLHDLPYQTVLGTSLTMLLFPSLVGAIINWRKQNFVSGAHLQNLVTASRFASHAPFFRYLPLITLLAGTGIGAIAGAEAALHIPEEVGRSVLAIFLIATGIRQLHLVHRSAKSKFIKPIPPKH